MSLPCRPHAELPTDCVARASFPQRPCRYNNNHLGPRRLSPSSPFAYVPQGRRRSSSGRPCSSGAESPHSTPADPRPRAYPNRSSRGLVAAGLKDLNRPAQNISIPQNLGPSLLPTSRCTLHARLTSTRLGLPTLSAALTATGLIWVRWSFVITPVNYSLAGVNVFVAATGIASLYRALESVTPSRSSVGRD